MTEPFVTTSKLRDLMIRLSPGDSDEGVPDEGPNFDRGVDVGISRVTHELNLLCCEAELVCPRCGSGKCTQEWVCTFCAWKQGDDVGSEA